MSPGGLSRTGRAIEEAFGRLQHPDNVSSEMDVERVRSTSFDGREELRDGAHERGDRRVRVVWWSLDDPGRAPELDRGPLRRLGRGQAQDRSARVAALVPEGQVNLVVVPSLAGDLLDGAEHGHQRRERMRAE